jgi:hypothetical protein
MAKRQGLRTFDTSDVQGDGSWIKLRSMTVGEVLDLRRETEARANFRYRVGAWLGRLVRRRPPESEIMRRNLARTIQYVKAWNWVDDLGEPLPLPTEDRRVLERLTAEEMGVVSECVNGDRQSEEQKN